ncbi:hypothetical protein NIES4075_67310 [Tolypothrix sp. NIES-4075]|uniref:WYL domain-containing protein n=1 Tax=Tolypothrix sp. NIES-4075 TaxID=2005459 RepID=UPI000B5CECC3|nr:WYL domain-containing protein [Tolypothrix sp. NIES-4075]GAX45710.1 hypothetical protein NIES4075_67310 [Tolypothrix sp. NIES-4075]
MPNKVSHGEDIRERAKRVLEAILDFQEHNLVGCDNLSLLCEWKDKNSGNPQLLVQTTTENLVKLTSLDKYEDKLTTTQVREALHRMEDFLEILDDHRIPPKNGNAKWHFTLSLWSKNKETNLREFTQEWQRKWEQRHPKKSKQKSKISDVPEIVSPVQTQLSDNNIKKDVWSDERIEVLQKAVRLFTDMGQLEEALSIANLLLDRQELSIPLRTEIEDFLRTHKSPLRQEIDRYIDRNQPFKLSYQNTTGQLQNFTVHYAKVITHEERQYVDCWCEETEGNYDLEQLCHNRSLRLERIREVQVSPIDGEWLSDFDTIKVEMHLLGGLLNGYKSKKNDDISNKLVEVNGHEVRRVLRKVSNTFWFFREVIRYGKDCVIVAPESVRDRFKEKLIPLCQLYNLTISD